MINAESAIPFILNQNFSAYFNSSPCADCDIRLCDNFVVMYAKHISNTINIYIHIVHMYIYITVIIVYRTYDVLTCRPFCDYFLLKILN